MYRHNREIIEVLRQLALHDIVIDTFLKSAEVDARTEMVGEKVNQEYIDDVIALTGMKTLVLSIVLFQNQQVKALENELNQLKQAQ